MNYTQQHIDETEAILKKIDPARVEEMAELLSETKVRGGRLFFLGVGGEARPTVPTQLTIFERLWESSLMLPRTMFLS